MHLLDSPWVLVIVLVVAGLDALLPFMPSESTVVACGVAAAATGRPNLALLVVAAALGAYAGDVLAFRIGRRGTGKVVARLRHDRAVAVHDWVRRLLHSRGALIVMFGRYVPGGRSTTMLAAGIVGYPSRRFHLYAAAGVSIWAVQAALLGYLGGTVFEHRPILGFLVAGAVALGVTGLAVLIQQATARRPSGQRERQPSA